MVAGIGSMPDSKRNASPNDTRITLVPKLHLGTFLPSAKLGFALIKVAVDLRATDSRDADAVWFASLKGRSEASEDKVRSQVQLGNEDNPRCVGVISSHHWNAMHHEPGIGPMPATTVH